MYGTTVLETPRPKLTPPSRSDGVSNVVPALAQGLHPQREVNPESKTRRRQLIQHMTGL